MKGAAVLSSLLRTTGGVVAAPLRGVLPRVDGPRFEALELVFCPPIGAGGELRGANPSANCSTASVRFGWALDDDDRTPPSTSGVRAGGSNLRLHAPKTAHLVREKAVSRDLASLRRAFGRFPSEGAIVCTAVDGVPRGLGATLFTAVSLDPPLVSICIRASSVANPPTEHAVRRRSARVPGQRSSTTRLDGIARS